VSIIDQIAFDQIADERDKAQQENKLLKDRIKRLEEECDRLEKSSRFWCEKYNDLNHRIQNQ
jgi:cell division septum initiation protein DivIVA